MSCTFLTYEGDEAAGVLWVALVAHHLLVRVLQGVDAAAGAAGGAGLAVAAGLGLMSPTQTQAPPETRYAYQHKTNTKHNQLVPPTSYHSTVYTAKQALL